MLPEKGVAIILHTELIVFTAMHSTMKTHINTNFLTEESCACAEHVIWKDGEKETVWLQHNLHERSVRLFKLSRGHALEVNDPIRFTFEKGHGSAGARL